MRRATTSPSTRRRRPSAAGHSARPTRSASRRRRSSSCGPTTYRRGGRSDAPFVVLLRFNQPVDRADVAAALAAKFESHSWDQPSISAAAQQRLAAIDPTSVERFNAKVAATRAAVASTAPVALRLTNDWDKKRYPAPPDARGLRDGDPRSVAELGQAHARRRAQVTGRAGDAGSGSGVHAQGRTGPLRLGVRLHRHLRSRQPESSRLPHSRPGVRVRQISPRHRRHDWCRHQRPGARSAGRRRRGGGTAPRT